MQPCACASSTLGYNLTLQLCWKILSVSQPSCFLAQVNMPYCVVCGNRFKGRGSYCVLHHTSGLDHAWRPSYNYSSDSTDPSSVRCHVDHRNHYRRLRVSNGDDNYDPYSNTNALVRYGHGHASKSGTALAQPLVQTFTTLSHNHAISALTYTITPSGAQSLTAEANFDREQCPVCRKWFPDHQKLDDHRYEFPAGCEIHGLCLRLEDVLWHGTSERHERCFIKGCGSVYRKEGGWKAGVVEGHIRSWHS